MVVTGFSMAVWAAIKLATDLPDSAAVSAGRTSRRGRPSRRCSTPATVSNGGSNAAGRPWPEPGTPPDAPPEAGTETGDTVRLQLNVVLGLRLMA